MRVLGVVVGGVGLAIGLSVCGWSYLLYRAMPPFERTPEPLFFFFDFMRLIVFGPIVTIFAVGAVIIGASLRLIVVTWQSGPTWGRPGSLPLPVGVVRGLTGATPSARIPSAPAPTMPAVMLPDPPDSSTMAAWIVISVLA